MKMFLITRFAASSIPLLGGILDDGTVSPRLGVASPSAVDYSGAAQPYGNVHLLRQRQVESSSAFHHSKRFGMFDIPGID